VQIAEVEGQLASPPLEWSPARVAEIAQAHAELSSQLEAAMSAWENLHLENEQTAAELARLKEGVSYGAE
jgi:cell division protein FtsB